MPLCLFFLNHSSSFTGHITIIYLLTYTLTHTRTHTHFLFISLPLTPSLYSFIPALSLGSLSSSPLYLLLYFLSYPVLLFLIFSFSHFLTPSLSLSFSLLSFPSLILSLSLELHLFLYSPIYLSHRISLYYTPRYLHSPLFTPLYISPPLSLSLSLSLSHTHTHTHTPTYSYPSLSPLSHSLPLYLSRP